MSTSPRQTQREKGEYMKEDVYVVGDQVASRDRASSLRHGDYRDGVQARAPARRRLSTKGIRRPGYRRRVAAPFSYVELISMAIKSSPHCMLTLREILAHLKDNNQCFQGSYVGWKNSVRHNLSSSRCFVKLLRNTDRPFAKDNFWAMNPDCTHCLAAKPKCHSHTEVARSTDTSLHQLSPIDLCLSTHRTAPEHEDVSAPSSPIDDPPPIESSPTVLSASAPATIVTIQQPEDLATSSKDLATSSNGDGGAGVVQLLPLDLSMPSLSKDKNHSSREAGEGCFSRPHSSHEHVHVSGRPVPEVCYLGERHNCTHHNLPVSRFLNSPPKKKDNSLLCRHFESRVAVTDQNISTSSTTNAYTYFPRVQPYAMRRPSSTTPGVYGFKSATRSSAAKSYTPQDVVPGIPVRMFQSLYDHYWRPARPEREALYHRKAKLPNWYQYPAV